MKTNALYYGDNLKILHENIDDESVDLVYLDPPFNSNRDYNVIFKDESGNRSDAQIVAFEDTWHWGPRAELTLAYLTTTFRHRGRVPSSVSTLIDALVLGIGKNQLLAYIVEMTARLVELHRVLKPIGSLYLHCDPTASHYLKLVLDTVFGPRQFRNEIIWKRTSAHSDAKQGGYRLGRIHDVILFYAKGPGNVWNPQYTAYTEKHVASKYTSVESGTGRRFTTSDLTGNKPGGDTSYEWNSVRPPEGRYWAYSKDNMAQFEADGRLVYTRTGFPRYKRFLDEMNGVPLQDLWTDIPPVNAMALERLGWDTQKPVALLERIITASSNPGDIVLDPFCGCGTAIDAAQRLGRNWIGIDITWLAIGVMRRRLEDSFGLTNIDVINRPTEIGWAYDAAKTSEGRYEVQWWALDLVGAMPVGGTRKKGADRGIDGLIQFPDRLGKMASVIVSVKSGKVNSPMVRDLVGVVHREKAAVGLFITLDEPTREMTLEAAKAGLFTDAGGRDYPQIQILTIDELLNQGKAPQLPSYVLPPYRRASRVPVAVNVQQGAFLDEDGQPIEPVINDPKPVTLKPEDVAEAGNMGQPKAHSRARRKAASAG